ncbi:tetratricopeptide repeat protein [bacterium]|nr:tetratricopeptide repeat protein [bacterium]
MSGRISSGTLDYLSEFLSTNMGLFFSPERRLDLLRGIRDAADAFGFKEASAFIRWIMSAPLNRRQIEVLARYLTVGETYFYREKRVLEALEKYIFPVLVNECKKTGRPLKIWSAGCCTGEEPYTMAMMLDQLTMGMNGLNVTIIGTDINPQFLQKAERGIYTEWSFRGTPAYIKERYFKDLGKGEYQIVPHIRNVVEFGYLNLAVDTFPGSMSGEQPVDIILCRNVLMYFKPEKLRDIVEKFYHSLDEEGWLIVGPSESSHVNFGRYHSVEFPGAILYKKTDQNIPAGAVCKVRAKRKAITRPAPRDIRDILQESKPAPPPVRRAPETAQPVPAVEEVQPRFEPVQSEDIQVMDRAIGFYQNADYPSVTNLIKAHVSGEDRSSAELMLLAARSYANMGQVTTALEWVEKAISDDKLNPDSHHLRAALLQEQNRLDEAAESLRRVLYLDPDYMMAHFMLGNLYRQRGYWEESEKHFNNTLLLLKDKNPDSILPDTDGMTAGGLFDCINYLKNKDYRA